LNSSSYDAGADDLIMRLGLRWKKKLDVQRKQPRQSINHLINGLAPEFLFTWGLRGQTGCSTAPYQLSKEQFSYNGAVL